MPCVTLQPPPAAASTNNASGRSPSGGPAIVRGKFIVLGRSHPGAGDFLLAPVGASYAVPTLECEWWVTVASTPATVCCSCRHHKRRRRCLRRHAAPRSTSMSTARVSTKKGHRQKQHTNRNASLLLLVNTIVREADFSDFSFIFVCKCALFCSLPFESVTFPRKTVKHPNWLMISSRKDTFPKNMEIVEDFVEISYNNTDNSWKSSRILRGNFQRF